MVAAPSSEITSSCETNLFQLCRIRHVFYPSLFTAIDLKGYGQQQRALAWTGFFGLRALHPSSTATTNYKQISVLQLHHVRALPLKRGMSCVSRNVMREPLFQFQNTVKHQYLCYSRRLHPLSDFRPRRMNREQRSFYQWSTCPHNSYHWGALVCSPCGCVAN